MEIFALMIFSVTTLPHAEFGRKKTMARFSHCFGEEASELMLRSNMRKMWSFRQHMFTNGVAVSGLLMKNRIGSNLYSTCVVNKKQSGTEIWKPKLCTIHPAVTLSLISY
eukprot:TRINITY_DN10287_c6_g2_i1.p1 TRINITY_DN10287_c6_g2~~TRINITY_DN10287_c6_g2_i1.p1  ORF type:complete len:110 (+),score=14.36 TRINITY_DN10287_c6_g2_i1:75-404(+)